MSVGPASSRGNVSEQDAAARRAAEEARRAAEAARRAAEAARKAAEAQQAAEAALKSGTAFEGTPSRQAEFDKRLGTEAPATSLLTEDAKDGQVNCLDVAADWANKATPELRGRSEMVFLKDTRAGAEGESGHVVVRQGESVFDPTTKKSYESLEAFKKAQPHYEEAGSLSANHVKNILAAPPGSPERAAALERAKVPPGLQKMMVADSEKPATPTEQATQDYEQGIKGLSSQAERSSPFTELVSRHRHDPEYLAQLVKCAKEDGTLAEIVDPRLSKGDSPLDRSLFDKDDKGQYPTNPGAGECRNDVLIALDAAKAKGTLTDQEIGGLAQKSAAWGSIVQEMQPGWSGPRVAGTEIRSAQGRFDQAREKAKEKSQELQKLVAGFGPALTTAQQQKLITKFKNEPESKAIFAAEAQAAKDLAATVEKHKEGILKSAATNPSGAKDLYTSLQTLANSGAAKTALDLVIDIKNTPALKEAFAGFKDFDKDITEPAISGGLSQYIAEKPDDPKGAIADFQKKMDGLESSADDNVKPLFDIQGGVSKFMQGFEDQKLPSSERATLLKNLAKEFEGQNPLGRGLLKAALIAWSVENGAGDKSSTSEAIKEFSKATQGGAELFAGATQSLVDAGKLTQYTSAAKHADFVARVTPGLGLLANSASAWVNASELASGDGNVGNVIALCGDVIGIVGSGLEAFPVTAPAGALVGGLGAVINAGGEILASHISGEKDDKEAARKEKEFNNKRAEYLHAAVNDPKLEEILLNIDGRVAQKLTQDLKMDPKDVQRLTKKIPGILNGDDRALEQLDGLKQVADRLKLDSQQLVQFVEGITQGTEKPELALETVLQHFVSGSSDPVSEVKNKDELVAALKKAYKTFNPKGETDWGQVDFPTFDRAYKNAIRAAERL